MLTVTFLNDRTGTDESANYRVEVFVNQRKIHQQRVEGHNRDDDWRELVRRLVTPQGGREA